MNRPSTAETFDSVLAAAQSGAEWAFAALYEEFNPRLVRYFAAPASAAAEDLAAETWLGAARGLRSFHGDKGEFRSWLFTIAHRRMADHWTDLNKGRAKPVEPPWMEGVRGPGRSGALGP